MPEDFQCFPQPGKIHSNEIETSIPVQIMVEKSRHCSKELTIQHYQHDCNTKHPDPNL